MTLMAYVTSTQPANLDKMQPLLKYVDSSLAVECSAGGRGDSAVRLVRSFFRLRQLLEHGGAQGRGEAASLLRAMLDPSSNTPRQFWPELLNYTVPLMEGGGPPLFSSDDVLLFIQVWPPLGAAVCPLDVLHASQRCKHTLFFACWGGQVPPPPLKACRISIP